MWIILAVLAMSILAVLFIVPNKIANTMYDLYQANPDATHTIRKLYHWYCGIQIVGVCSLIGCLWGLIACML